MSKVRIERIEIKGTKKRNTPDSHIAYEIEVSTKAKKWTVFHRYSDFDELHASLTKVYKSAIREQLPPKKMFGSNSPEVAEERRIGLEKYLRSILMSEDQRPAQDPLFHRFLEFDPPSKETLFESVDPNNWIEQYEVLQSLSSSIAEHITNYEKGGDNEEQLQAKKKLTQLNSKITFLGDRLNSSADSSITEKEALRRRDLLSKLRIEKDSLEQRLKNPRIYSENRSELIKGGSTSLNNSNNKGPRVLGKIEETDQTRNLDNSGLLSLQKETINTQDKQLDDLLSVLQRQAHIGRAISDELDHQNELLDDLDVAVDNTKSKLKKTGKTLTKVSANA